jgi:hypothetical protein
MGYGRASRGDAFGGEAVGEFVGVVGEGRDAESGFWVRGNLVGAYH